MRIPRLPTLLAAAILLLGGLLADARPAGAVGQWSPAAPMHTPHAVLSATLLPDRRVLATALDPDYATAIVRGAAELYDPAADRWTVAAGWRLEGGNATPVVLPDGRVLFTGGAARSGVTPSGLYTLSAAQVYDASADRWSPVAPLTTARTGHTATLLRDGTVLVVGGFLRQGEAPPTAFATAERYDPRGDRWLPAGQLAAPRGDHTATLLADGRVLVAGGDGGFRRADDTWVGPLATAEVYDPATDRWSAAGALGEARAGHTAALLPGGQVLIFGGAGGQHWTLRSAERYDPRRNAWEPAGALPLPLTAYAAAPLPDGRVLVSGGQTPEGVEQDRPLAATAIYDPATDRWAGAAPLGVARWGHVATPLADGGVLVVGGITTLATSAPAAIPERYAEARSPAACFAETGRCLRGPFLAYWVAHGGLALNGFPLSDEFIELLEDGQAYQVQYCERVRLEYHPENAPPYDILLGQFGRRILREQTGYAVAPPAPPLPGGVYFAETGHNLGGRFLAYWRGAPPESRGLAQFGFPISEEFVETLEDGNSYTVQYFERARFEWHPEHAGTPYEVLLGQFGRRVLAQADR